MAEVPATSNPLSDFINSILDRLDAEFPTATSWPATKAKIKEAIASASGSAPPGAADAVLLNWINAAVRSVVAAWNSPDLSPTVSYLTAEADSEKKAVDVTSLVALWEDVSQNPEKLAGTLPDAPFAVVAWILQKSTGLTFSGDQIENLFVAPDIATMRSGLGKILTDLYGETLKTEKAAEGWLARTPGTAELENFRQLSGAAMRLALGGLLAEWGKDIIPFGVGRALEGIAEKLNDAIALDDALEEVVQVPMQAVIQRGLEAHYNRALKPADLSASEALKATIAGKLSQENLTKVLDNAGYRDDIRQILRDNAASNLTESDLDKGYQWNLLTREDVKKRYRDNAFEEPDAELKTKLVEMERRQKLREKVFELYGNLYRDGVATKQEVTPFLESYGYDADEVEMWFQVQELERRQRKWISDANLLKLIMSGAMTESAALEYWVLQGMERGDATTLLTLAVKEEKEAEVKNIEREVKATIAKLPKAVRDKCDDLFKPEDILGDLLAKLIGLIPAGLGEIAGALKLKDMIECALKNLGSTTPTAP